MQKIWIIFVSLAVLGICSALPISATSESSAAPWLVGTLLLLGAALITVGGCLCCKKKRGFQEFKDETLSSTSTLNAQAQFPIFRPLDQTAIQNQQCYVQNEQTSPPSPPSATINTSNIQNPLVNTHHPSNIMGLQQSQADSESLVNNSENSCGVIQNVQHQQILPPQINVNNAGREENALQMNVQSTSGQGNVVESQSHFSNIVSSSLAFASNNLEALRYNIQLMSNNVDDNNDYDDGDNNNGPISELDIQNIANNNAEGYIRNQNEILAEEHIIQEVIPIRPTVDPLPIPHVNDFARYVQPDVIINVPSTSSSSVSTFINIETLENTSIDKQNQNKENLSLPLNNSYSPETNVSLVSQMHGQKYHNVLGSPKTSETNFSNVSNIVSSKMLLSQESQVPMVTEDIIVDVEDINLGFQEYVSDNLEAPAVKINSDSTNLPKDTGLENISSVVVEKLEKVEVAGTDAPLPPDTISTEEFISETEQINKNDSFEENENIKLSISSEDSDSGVNEALRVLESVLSCESDGESSNTSLEDVQPNFEDLSDSKNDESYYTVTENFEVKSELQEDDTDDNKVEENPEKLTDEKNSISKIIDEAKEQIILPIENIVDTVVAIENVDSQGSVNIIDYATHLHFNDKNEACPSDKNVEIAANNTNSKLDSDNMEGAVETSLKTTKEIEENIFLGDQWEKILDKSSKIELENITQKQTREEDLSKVISDVVIKTVENEDPGTNNNTSESISEITIAEISDVKRDKDINIKSDIPIINETSRVSNREAVLKEETMDNVGNMEATPLENLLLQKIQNNGLGLVENLMKIDRNSQFIETEVTEMKKINTEVALNKDITLSSVTESVGELLHADIHHMSNENTVATTAAENLNKDVTSPSQTEDSTSKSEFINDIPRVGVIETNSENYIIENELSAAQETKNKSQYEVKFIEVCPKPLNTVEVITNNSQEIENNIDLNSKFEEIVKPITTMEDTEKEIQKERNASLDAVEKVALEDNSVIKVTEEVTMPLNIMEYNDLKSGNSTLEIGNYIAPNEDFVHNKTNSTEVKIHHTTNIPEIIIDECFDTVEDDEFDEDIHEGLSDCVKDDVSNIKETDSGVVSIDEVCKLIKCEISDEKQDNLFSEQSVSEDLETDKSVGSTAETVIVKLEDNFISDIFTDSKRDEKKGVFEEQICDATNVNIVKQCDATFADCDKNSNNDNKLEFLNNENFKKEIGESLSESTDSKVSVITEKEILHVNPKESNLAESKMEISEKVSELDYESNKENECLYKVFTEDIKNNVNDNIDNTENKENEKSVNNSEIITKPSKFETVDRCKDFLFNEQRYNSKIHANYNNKISQNEAVFTSTPKCRSIHPKQSKGNLQKALFLKSISPTDLNDEELGLNKLQDTDSLEEEQIHQEIDVNYLKLKGDDINLESWDKFLVDSFEQNVSDHDSSEIFETNDCNATFDVKNNDPIKEKENLPNTTFEIVNEENKSNKGFFLHPQKDVPHDLNATYEKGSSENRSESTLNYNTQNHNDESHFLDCTYDTKQEDDDDTDNDLSLDLNNTFDILDENMKIEEIRRKLTNSLPNAQSSSDDEGNDFKENKCNANFEPRQGSSHFPDFEPFEELKIENPEIRQELVIRYNDCNPSRRFLSPILEEWDGEKDEEKNIEEDSDDVFEDNKILSSDTDRTFILNETRCLDSTSFSEQNVTSSDKPRPVLASWCSNDTLFNVEDNFETNGQNDIKPADVENREENIDKNEEFNEKVEKSNSSIKNETVIIEEHERKREVVLESELSEGNVLNSDEEQIDKNVLQQCTDEESKNYVKDSGNATDENMSSIIDNIDVKLTETSTCDITKGVQSTNPFIEEPKTSLQLPETNPNLSKSDSGLLVTDVNIINIPICISSAENSPEHKANSKVFEESTLVTLSDKTDPLTGDLQDDEVLSEIDDLSTNSEATCSKSEEYELHHEEEDNNIGNENGFNLNGENDPWITDVKYSDNDIMTTSFSSESPNLTPLSPNLSPKLSPNLFRNNSLENIVDEDTGWESEDTSGEFEWRAGDFESTTHIKSETDSKNKSTETDPIISTIESKHTVQKDMISEDIEIEDLEENVVTFNNALYRCEPLSSLNSDINYQPIADFESQNESNGDNEESCSESSEEMEFIPSSWDALATPSRSSMKSPEKSNSGTKKQRSVVFKQEKYISVYEYPREQEQCSYIEEPNVSSMFTMNPMDDDDVQEAIRGSYYNRFFVTSSSMPFARSQFTVPPQESVVDSNTEPFSWSQYDQFATEEFLRESEVDEISLEPNSIDFPQTYNNDTTLIDLSESENTIIENAQPLDNINNQEQTHDQTDSDTINSDNTTNPFKENVTVIRVNDNNFFENYSPFEQNDQYGPMSANFWLTDEISTSFMSPETPELNVNNFNSSKTNLEHLNQLSDFLTPDSGIEITPNPDNGSKNLINLDQEDTVKVINKDELELIDYSSCETENFIKSPPNVDNLGILCHTKSQLKLPLKCEQNYESKERTLEDGNIFDLEIDEPNISFSDNIESVSITEPDAYVRHNVTFSTFGKTNTPPKKSNNLIELEVCQTDLPIIDNSSSSLNSETTNESPRVLTKIDLQQFEDNPSADNNFKNKTTANIEMKDKFILFKGSENMENKSNGFEVGSNDFSSVNSGDEDSGIDSAATFIDITGKSS